MSVVHVRVETETAIIRKFISKWKVVRKLMRKFFR